MRSGTVSFYVGAHPDDWQIFAGHKARDDYRAHARVVFIYLTAGDESDRYGPGWWEAREMAARASTELLASSPEGPEERPLFCGRPIAKCEIGRTTSYFLRLPDGRLQELLKGVSALDAVDNSASYPGWGSLTDVVGAILDFESGSYLAQKPWINTSDYLCDPFPRPPEAELDNPDHYATGDVVRLNALGKYRVLYWAGYDETRRREWVSREAYEYKRSLMLKYHEVLEANYRVPSGARPVDYQGAMSWYENLMRWENCRTEGPDPGRNRG